jgi:small subunit ribosomal protein S4
LGAPKRNRKKFEKPKERWNLERIKSDNALIDEYGLKNMKELWKIQTEISRIRRNVRELLSGGSDSEEVKEKIIGRLTRLGVASQTTTLDNLLDIKESDLLNRRLQTVVYKKGLARTIKQSRQITVHGFIAINGKRVNRPGYMVDVDAENHITYYKPIDVAPPKQKSAETTAEEPKAEPQEAANA